MNCPECGSRLPKDTPFCRCGWPEPREEFAVCPTHGTGYDPRSLCRLCVEGDGIPRRECDCGTRLDEDGDCPGCLADLERMNRQYGWGDVRAAMAPVTRTWRSREDLMRDTVEED